MTASSLFLTMALNSAWANATLYHAIMTLPSEGFDRAAPGFFGSLQATMNHIYEVDLFYVDALEAGGIGRAVYDRTAIRDPKELATAQAEVDKRLTRFCRDLGEQDLVSIRSTHRTSGHFDERVDALLMHLFQHQIHHRGQAHVQLQYLGIAPPQLDEFHLQFDRAPSAAAYFPQP